MQKIYFSISEVAEQLELEQHVLRYWETEFSELKPQKNRAGNRVYKDRDIDIVKKIQYLLYEELFTIEGARKKLKMLKKVELEDYKKSQALLSEPDFVRELQKILGLN